MIEPVHYIEHQRLASNSSSPSIPQYIYQVRLVPTDEPTGAWLPLDRNLIVHPETIFIPPYDPALPGLALVGYKDKDFRRCLVGIIVGMFEVRYLDVLEGAALMT